MPNDATTDGLTVAGGMRVRWLRTTSRDDRRASDRSAALTRPDSPARTTRR